MRVCDGWRARGGVWRGGEALGKGSSHDWSLGQVRGRRCSTDETHATFRSCTVQVNSVAPLADGAIACGTDSGKLVVVDGSGEEKLSKDLGGGYVSVLYEGVVFG